MIAQSTICAPATSGQGAIAVIRVSGPDSISIASVLFRSLDDSALLFQALERIDPSTEGRGNE